MDVKLPTMSYPSILLVMVTKNCTTISGNLLFAMGLTEKKIKTKTQTNNNTYHYFFIHVYIFRCDKNKNITLLNLPLPLHVMSADECG